MGIIDGCRLVGGANSAGRVRQPNSGVVPYGQATCRRSVGLVRWEGKLAGFVSNDPTLGAQQMLTYFVHRWSVETTVGLVRAHLGRAGVPVETQRPWSDAAIRRTTPVLLGLFSLITLLAQGLSEQGLLPSQSSSWYAKAHPTFSDALAGVRRHFWRQMYFQTSSSEADIVKLPLNQFQLWENALTWAAYL